MACRPLGVSAFAHVVEIANADLGQIEEDRCRQDLLPSEMYRTTEALRPRMEDDAWARKVLGKAIDKAMKKGRVDDLVASHVGISRGSYCKIREIMTAWTKDPERFDATKLAMEADRRIDRHYKAFKALVAPAYSGWKLQAIAFKPNRQDVSPEDSNSVNIAVQLPH